MTPASRPIVMRHLRPEQPDYVVPPLIEAAPAALDCYHAVMRDTWEAIRQLLELGTDVEYAMYLLPNAFPIRFEESGDLLNLHHKWTTRLCYAAQEEIWRACKEEVEQVAAVAPALARWITAPCGLRLAAQVAPYCPEGERFCGVAVWKLPVARYERLI